MSAMPLIAFILFFVFFAAAWLRFSIGIRVDGQVRPDELSELI